MENSNFVTQFYNIEGDLVSERKKNFFKLLKSQPAPLTEDDLKNLSPRTYLERLFEIDIFIYFKISTKLLDVIKGGNEVFISKVLKHPSTLLQALGTISSETFVNDFLPCTSYAIRMKILKKISFFLDESQMDDIVSSVHKRYGLNIATKIVHTCSSKKIKEFLCNHEVILKQRQLEYIADKDPELLLTYLSDYKKSTGRVYSHKKLCRYIALQHPEMLVKLQKEHIISCSRLGRNSSKNLIRHNTTDFFNGIEFYSKFLKPDVMVRQLHGRFKEVYFELFPKNMQDMEMRHLCYKLLQFYPKKKQWDLFTQAFTRTFGENILDNLQYLTMDFVKFFPNKDIMYQWAEVDYDKTKNNSTLEFYEPSKAILLMKELINSTPDYRRNNLMEALLRNCKRNEDLTSLEGVLQCISLVCSDEYIVCNIFDMIWKYFKLEEFNENHWKYITEMIPLLRSAERLIYFLTFPLKHIEYLALHKKPFRKELLTYIEDYESYKDEYYQSRRGKHFVLKNPQSERQILLEAVDASDEPVKFINDIIDFNGRNPEFAIDIASHPILLPYIESVLDHSTKKLEADERDILSKVISYNLTFPAKPIIAIEESRILEIFRCNIENFGFDEAVVKIVTKSNRSKFENDVLQFFWDHLLDRYIICMEVIRWLFLNEPKSIVPYLDRLWKVNETYIAIKDIRLMSHLGFDQSLKDYCTGKLKYVDDFLKKINETGNNDMEVDGESKVDIELKVSEDVIECLTKLLTTSEYVEIVAKRLLPSKAKIDLNDEEIFKIFYLQREVAKSFKKMQEPGAALPTLMKFCLGDYLHLALPSLYSVCYRSPEILLYPHMDELSKKAVSARKHALFLSCELLNFDYTVNKLQNSRPRNISSQKHVFSATLKYYRKNPSEDLWNLVSLNLGTINKHDDETLHSLVMFDSPKRNKEVYIEKCWYTLENLREKEVDVESYLESFLDSIIRSDDILALLPVNFYRHIITHYFKSNSEDRLYNIYQFVSLVLRNLKSEQSNNFNYVFDIITLLKSNYDTEIIKTFFSNFYNTAVKDISSNGKIDAVNNSYIELFKQYWCATFTPIEMFDEYVLLNLLYLRCKSSVDLIENYAKEVVIYLEELVAEYGPYIYHRFMDLVFHMQSFTNKEKYMILYNILKFKSSTMNCLLVIDLLKCQCCNDEVKEIHCEILEVLKNLNQPVVSMFLNSNF